jgi:D-arabinono-1,4-lactone oxidase
MSTPPLLVAEDGLYHPSTEAEIVALVQYARATKKRLRVRGSLHTFPRLATFTAGGGEELHVQLDQYRAIVAVDDASRRIEVQGGCNLYVDPNLPSSNQNNSLLQFIDNRGWALSDLGGITHQTVAGFISTGSSGGSLRWAIEENIVALRIIDGTGTVRVFERGKDEGFAGAVVALGLFGVISTVTVQCEGRYAISGQEVTSTLETCAVDLFDGGGNGRASLETFLLQADYTRFIWWPQKGVDLVTIWQAERMAEIPPGFVPVPYEPSGVKVETVQALAGLLLSIVGNLRDLPNLPPKIEPIFEELDEDVTEDLEKMGFSEPVAFALGKIVNAMIEGGVDGLLALPGIDTLGEFLYGHLDDIIPVILNAFVKTDADARDGMPLLFQDYWWRCLPMDNAIHDALMPTWFTEIWIPVERASEVMRALREHFQGGIEKTGTYCFEFYAAKKNEVWMSPAHGVDVFRVDPFWFGYNEGDPAAFFQQFWDLLKPFDFRLHPGKYMPPDPDGEWAAYFRKQLPKWDAWHALRKQMDPDGVFLTPYWREHFGVKDV